MSAQLQFETSRPVSGGLPASAASPSSGAGREELSYPTDRETAERWAENFRRRGVACEAVKVGKQWVVVG